jgi:hypothetical protein
MVMGSEMLALGREDELFRLVLERLEAAWKNRNHWLVGTLLELL